VIIPDGALIPTRNRAAHPELYSDKRHQSGAAVQILSGIEGRLHHVGEPIAGSIHDVRTFRQTGPAAALTEHMTNNLVIADLDYRGEPVVTPVSKPLKGKLSPAQIKANKRLSSIRSAVERRIAHLKTGRRWPPDSVDHCENSPSASQQSPHSNYTDSTGPLLNMLRRAKPSPLPLSNSIISHRRRPRQPGYMPQRRDVQTLSAAPLLKTSRKNQQTRPPVPLRRPPPSIHCRQWAYQATASHLSPTTPTPTPHPEEHEVIKVSQLMDLTLRISMSIKILGRSKDGHTRPQHWQANMDVRCKFRYRRPTSGNFNQNGRARVAVGDPDPTAKPHGTTHEYPTCSFEWTDDSSPPLILTWTCTQKLGHQGQHLASTGDKRVAAVHPQ
jgi:hypothetical protein